MFQEGKLQKSIVYFNQKKKIFKKKFDIQQLPYQKKKKKLLQNKVFGNKLSSNGKLCKGEIID